MKTLEEWRQIKGYPSYEVSSLGRVRSKDKSVTVLRNGKTYERLFKGKLLKLTVTRDRGIYCQVGLYNDEGSWRVKVHGLVARAFLGKPPKGTKEVMHLDDDGLNNKVGNLQWGSTKDNSDDKVSKGRQARGSTQGLSFLTEKQVVKIKKMQRAGISGRDIATKFGVTDSLVSHIKHGYTWAHVEVPYERTSTKN